MHLVLGEPHDPLSAGVHDALVARNCATRLISSPVFGPLHFAWRLDASASRSTLRFDDGLELRDEEISGVFVGSVTGPDPHGWEMPDLLYTHSEAHAAVLAWLWSLDCPVVNRADARAWYQPNPPLLSWRRRLLHAGLPTLDALVSNVPEEARAFARRGPPSDADAVVFGPLTNQAGYLVAGDDEWDGLAVLQRNMPVTLTYPHGAAHFACVVGDEVVWDSAAPSEARAFEPALRAFAAHVGLTMVEVDFAPVDGRLVVINVDPRPQLHHFERASGIRIVEAIADFLTAHSRVPPAEPVAVG